MRLFRIFAGIAASLCLALSISIAQAEQKQEKMATADIVETAKTKSEFSTFVKALEATGLDKELEAKGPYTVFAPTDAAFDRMGKAKVDDLMKPENKDKLASILKYHVISGEMTSSELRGKKMDAETLEGDRLSIDATKGVKVEDANVTEPDIEASNGVIHGVDKVFEPD